MKVVQTLLLSILTSLLFVAGCTSDLVVDESVDDPSESDTTLRHSNAKAVLEIINMPAQMRRYSDGGKNSDTVILPALENFSIIDSAAVPMDFRGNYIEALIDVGFKYDTAITIIDNDDEFRYTRIFFTIAFSNQSDMIDTLHYYYTYVYRKGPDIMIDFDDVLERQCTLLNVPFTRESNNTIIATLPPTNTRGNLIHCHYGEYRTYYSQDELQTKIGEEKFETTLIERPTDSTLIRITIK